MKRPKLGIPLSIVLFLALTLAGTYWVRKGLLERAMAKALEAHDDAMIRSVARMWPCPVRAETTTGWTALHWAAETGDVEAAARLLAKGAVVDSRGTDFGRTPLIVAAEWGRREIAELLIRHGADVNASTRVVHVGEETTGFALYFAALDYAVERADAEMVKLLLSSGASAKGSGSCDMPPLRRAVEMERRDIAQMLIDHGAELEMFAEEGLPPLHVAVINQHRFLVEMLLANRVDLDRRDIDGASALHLAAREGDVEMIELLLSHGADVNARDKEGATPLSYARTFRHADAAEALLGHGAREQ